MNIKQIAILLAMVIGVNKVAMANFQPSDILNPVDNNSLHATCLELYDDPDRQQIFDCIKSLPIDITDSADLTALDIEKAITTLSWLSNSSSQISFSSGLKVSQAKTEQDYTYYTGREKFYADVHAFCKVRLILAGDVYTRKVLSSQSSKLRGLIVGGTITRDNEAAQKSAFSAIRSHLLKKKRKRDNHQEFNGDSKKRKT